MGIWNVAAPRSKRKELVVQLLNEKKTKKSNETESSLLYGSPKVLFIACATKYGLK